MPRSRNYRQQKSALLLTFVARDKSKSLSGLSEQTENEVEPSRLQKIVSNTERTAKVSRKGREKIN